MNKDDIIGDSTISAWLVVPGVCWVQTRCPRHARRLSQRKDTRLVAKGVAGGYLRIFEAKHPLSWAKRLIARHETNEEPTGGAFLRPESRCANRNFENGSSAVVKTERRRMAMK